MKNVTRLLGAAALLMAWNSNAWAASYGIAQVTFVPMREADIQTSLKNISTAVTGNIQTVIAITATDDGTIIVYDEWEDGYEEDIKNPTQSTTKIWGDGNLANGVAPGTADDLLNSGKSIALANAVNPLSPLTVDYDGRDKIGSTKAIAVSRGGWSITPGTVLAGAVNLIDVGNQGKVYTLPIGQNVITANPDSAANRLFEYTSAHIIASENATTVNIDKDGNGTTDLTVTLNQGETYLVNGGVNAGAKISSDKPVGVYVIAGDVGSTYENRWFAIPATEQWSNSYYAPVGTTLASDPSHVFLYNPSTTSAITVTYDTQTVKGSTVSVPANSTVYVPMLTASGAHFYTAGKEKFYAVSTIDSDATANQTHDWSYSLVPESYLTDKFVVAWGPGYDVNGSGAATAVNGSPVWVTAAADTTLNIDYNGDGVADTTYAIKALESYRIFDTDKDQTGLTVWTTDGTLITAAWGEDPSVAGAGNPYLDMGTTVMPFPDYVLRKSSMEASPVTYGAGVSDGDTKMELSEQVEYTVSIINRAVIDLFNINIKDTLSPVDSATYVPSSASLKIYSADGVTLLRDVPDLDDTADNFPLGASGYTITDTNPGVAGDQGLKRGEMAVIKYRVAVRSDINQVLAESKFVITNTVVMTGDPAGGGDPITKTTVNKTPLTVPFTDGEVYFYKSDFSSAATGYSQTNTLGLQVTDGDQNRDPAVAETVTVKVTNVATGETEDVVLTETGPNTGIFRNTLATSTNSANNGNNSGTLYMLNGQSIQVEYTDPISGSFADTPAAPGIVPAYTTGNPNIKIVPVAASLPVQTDGLLEIYDSSVYTTVKTSYQEGDTLYLQVTDSDQNTDASKADTVTVVVTNTTTGELETVVLTETGVNTGIFRASLTTSVSADSANNSGALHAVMGDALRADYTDGIFGASFDNPTHIGIAVGDDNNIDTGNANSVTGVFTKTKVLYLSDDGTSGDSTGDLDRIDPALISPVDNTTATTAAVTPGSTVTVHRTDNFTAAAYTGGTNWSGSWTETNDDASATAGSIKLVTGGTGGASDYTLQFSGGSATVRTIERLFTPLTSVGTIDFDYKVVKLDSADTGMTLYATSDGTTWNKVATIKGSKTTGGTDTGFTAYPGNSVNGTVAVTMSSLPVGTKGIRITYASSKTTDQLSLDNINISTTTTSSPAPVTFTQAISMANGFAMPQGAAVKVVTYVSSVTGTPTGTSVTATLKYGATTFATLSNPVYDSAAGILTWTGNVASAVSIPAGQAVSLVVTNGASGTSFKIDYDSATKPSRIELPTTTVINIVDVDNNAGNGIQKIGFYDQSFANGSGSLISSGTVNAGGIVYLRVKVLDPFGDYDITGLKLAIDGPGTAGDIGVPTPITLTNANIVNMAGDGSAYKTYEYAWQTVNNTGAYNISVTADEGYEGTITDVASSSFIVTAQDLGTPSTTMFITALGGVDAGPQYTAGSNAFLRVTDLDEAGSGTVTAVVNGITVTLTETGANTGIFEANLSLQNAAAFGNLPQGAVLVANYVDNDDATDTSSDTILVPSMTNLPPVNTVPGTQTVHEQVQTAIGGVSVVDPNGNLATTRLTVTGGVLNVNLSGGATISVGGNGSATLTLSGTEAQINAALATLQYTANNGTTTDTLTMVSTDSAGTPLSDTDIVNIEVQDPPVNTVPGTQTVSEQVKTPVSGVSVTDTNGNLTSTQLTVTGGLLNLTASGSAVLSGNDTGSVTITGNEADINATLASLKYTANDGTTADTVTMVSSDGTNLTDTDTFNIVVQDPPVNTVPGPQTVSEQVQTPVSGVSVTDTNGNLTSTQLTVTGGLLNLTASGSAVLSGNDTGSVIITGNEADINATLASLKYTANDGTTADTLTVLSTDGTSLTDTDTFDIEVQDPPVNTVPGTQTVSEQVKTPVSGVSVTDTNGNLTSTQLTVTGGLLNLTASGSAVLSGNDTGSVTITGNEADINATLASLKYTANDGTTADTVTMVSSDGTSLTDTDTFSIVVKNQPVIGSRVWIDENGNGKEDPGESGIPNVEVYLYSCGLDNDCAAENDNVLQKTTVTNANGEYLFKDVPPGSYVVRTVQKDGSTTTLPTGLQPTYDENGIATANTTVITVSGGQEYMTADFGYNWVAPTVTDTPAKTDTGAIGDRIWSDANGDGVQEPGEPGLGGVKVALLKDLNDDGVYGGAGDGEDTNSDGIYGGVGDTGAVTATTDNAGNYIFSNVSAGSYVIAVDSSTLPSSTTWTPTGDPDATKDGKTTSPIVLAPGDVYLQCDFGYKPATSGSVTGTVYRDVNADACNLAGGATCGDSGDNILNGGDTGISGVTVVLKDASGKIIATTLTDSSGTYSFVGLLNSNYTVAVTDTHNVLGEVVQSGDPDSTLDNQHLITALSGLVSNMNFGYTPVGQTTGKGMIGSTVFLDRDNSGDYNPGEGLEGVAVSLYKDGILVAVTQTDENGQYQFGNLPAGSYEVRVTTASLPNGGNGVTNTVDPNGGSDSKSVVTLTVDGSGAVQPNLTQNFGYVGSNTISGTIWNDVNADGTKAATETIGFSGVMVALLDSNGNIVATTTTDASGNYSFGKLPDGTYTVQVTDTVGNLTGLWLSDGLNDGLDNNSQVNGYSVTVNGGVSNTTADFGFYKDSTAFGGTLWNDTNNNGTLDSGETPLAHYQVVLTITYPNGVITTLTTLTDADGNYRFDNVMLDEDYNSVTGGPTYTITVPNHAGLVSTHTPATDDLNSVSGIPAADGKADNPAGEVVSGLVKGGSDFTRDFGFIGGATIGDRVWLDVNRDGVQSLNEPGLSSVTVKIYRDNGDSTFNSSTDTPVTTVVTDGNGNYAFAGLPPGNYWVDVITPSSLTPTQADKSGVDDALDSDKTASAGGGMITVTDSQVIDNLDFGYVGTKPLIGDTVWFDANNNGVQDPGEAGIAGVDVVIHPCGEDGTCGNADDNWGPDGVIGNADDIVDVTATTDAAGHYLRPVDTGKYTVTVATTGFNATPTNGDATRVVTVPAATDILSVDFGLTGSAASYTIGDLVWEDSNGDKTQNVGEAGIAGVTVDLYRDSIPVATTTTNASGAYQFNVAQGGIGYKVLVTDRSGILAGGISTNQVGGNNFDINNLSGDVTNADFGYQSLSIGDLVWLDVNGNGVQDADDPGMSGVKVELYLDGGSTPIRTETTGSDGLYNFSGMSAGKYVVKLADSNFTAGGALNSFTITIANAGDDAKDSDDTSSHAVAVTLGSSPISNTDFGFKAATGTGSVSGVVWEDRDKSKTINGTPVENGIAGVTVILYLDRNSDGKLDSGDQMLGTDVTDGIGAYAFGILPNGKYLVTVSGGDKLQGLYMTTASVVLPFEITDSVKSVVDKNFGFAPVVPTYVLISSFKAYINDDSQTVLEWKTDSEIGTIGFLLERLNEQTGEYEAVSELLPGMLTPPHGGQYRYVDPSAVPGKEHTYRVVEVAVNSEGAVAGPYTVRPSEPLPSNPAMQADGPEGYSLSNEPLSAKQARRAALRKQAEKSLVSQVQKKTGSTLKVPVSKDGLVYLTADRLAAASGLSKQQVTQRLKAKKCLVTLQGKRVPALYASNGGALWFYGQAPARNDIGRNIYYLELGKQGAAVVTATASSGRVVIGQSFAHRERLEENHMPFHLYINKPVRDFWAWEYLLAYGKEATVTHSIAAPFLTGNGSAVLTVNLVNISSSNSGNAAPYKAQVFLNGTELGGAETDAVGDWQLRLDVPASLLLESGNEVKIASQLNSGTVYSLIYLDSFELEYERKYEAADGALTFTSGKATKVTVDGFTSTNVLAMDISNPAKPVRLRTAVSKSQTVSDGFTVTVRTKPDRRYVITQQLAASGDETITADSPSQLRSSKKRADYLIIAPLHLMDSAKRLAEHRQGQGLTSMVVDIEDVQDEFSHGLAAPEAVHNFLAYVHKHWAQAPRYVALVGDGSYDYKNYLKYGWSAVPSVLVATPQGFFPSDNALADVAGNDGVPEFAVGRIPVFDKTEFDRYIDKVISYEQSAGSNSMTVVNDKNDPFAGSFKASAELVAGFAPEGMTVAKLDVDSLGATTVQARIKTAMQQGTGILHYIGHSSLIGFGKGNGLLSAKTIETMSPVRPPMLMVSMSCSAASFGYPAMNSIGESAVLRADGAAVGFFGATGLSFNHLGDIIAEGFYGSLFDQAAAPRLGDAVLESKRHYRQVKQEADVSTMDIYNLLGDPAVRMPVLH